VYTELGPQGFMPQDPKQLNEELAQRGLSVCGGTVFAGLHKGPGALEKAKLEFGQEAKLLAAVGAEYLVHLPEQYTDQHTGESTQGADIDPEQWKNLVTGTDELARFLFEEYGVKLVFHPHADTHVDTQERIARFLSDTDPELVNLCLDTGHVSYCDGDNIEIIEQFPERITYVHLKSVRRHRAGPVPRRAAHPDADRGTDRRLLRRMWAGSGAALAVLIRRRTRRSRDSHTDQKERP